MAKTSFSCLRNDLMGTLSGKMLISHPILDDEKFRKTIIFVESDDLSETSGFIINRPLNFMLKSFGGNFSKFPIGNAPVYFGGEHGESTVMLTVWVSNPINKAFEIYHSLDAEEATTIVSKHKNAQLRAYLGYTMFDDEIYNDIGRGFWVLGSPKNLFGAKSSKENLWKEMLLKESPHALVYS